MTNVLGPRALRADDETEGFDCGEAELNSWLSKYSFQAARSGSAQTFVLLQGTTVVGYYTLTTGAVEPSKATERARTGMPRHPIPVILLARLAVGADWQGKGLGAALLRDALVRSLSVSNEIGVRAVLVHAKSEAARAFYERYDFESMPDSDNHLMLLIKDIRNLLA